MVNTAIPISQVPHDGRKDLRNRSLTGFLSMNKKVDLICNSERACCGVFMQEQGGDVVFRQIERSRTLATVQRNHRKVPPLSPVQLSSEDEDMQHLILSQTW